MSLFLITGSAGTGKSTVCDALKKKGYTAYDVDVDGLAKWTNVETGYVHPKSTIKMADRTAEFLAMHRWYVSRQEVEQLLIESQAKTSFLCGYLGNEAALRDLFSGIIALYVDDDTLKDRLAMRTGNDWGAQEHEVQQTLTRHHKAYNEWRELGATVIETARSLDDIVEDIISATNTGYMTA